MQAKITEYINMMQKTEERVSIQETEIGLVPDDWKVVKLGDLINFSRKPRDLDLNLFEKIPFITMEMIPIGKTYINDYLLKEPDKISSGVYCEKGDILLPKITPCFENGKQGIIENIPYDFAFATTEVYPIKPKNTQLDKMFLFYFLIEPDVRRIIAGKMQGTTGRQRVPKDVVKNTLIPLPPLLEQQKIANVLGTIQRAIEQQDRIIDAAKNLKKSLMQKLFTEGLRGEEQKETEIGLIPKSWKLVKLGDVSDFKNGVNFTKDQKGNTGILTIDVLNMYGEGLCVNLQNLYRVNKEINDDYLLKDGDILFVRSSLKREGVGWASLYKEANEPVTFCGFIIRARLKSDDISPEFLTNFLRTSIAREKLIAGSGKVAITNINQGMLGQVAIPIPPLPEQQRIVHILSTVDRKIEVEERKKATLSELFKTMLHKLMTGEIRLKDVEV